VLKATVEGEMELCAINTPNYKGLGLGCPFKTNATVVPKISQELLSLSELFAKQGFKVILDPKGICELYLKDADTNHETRVPIRYDYGKRGFYIDCIMSNTPEHYELLASRISDIKENSNLKRQTALQASLIEQKDLPTVLGLLKGNDMVESCQCSNDDTERIFNFETRHTQTPPNPLQHFETQSKCCVAATKDPLIIRRDLKGNNGGMSFEEAHKLYLHKGNCPGCIVCKLVNGSTRYEHSPNPDIRIQSNRPGHTFTLDIIQWSHRSKTGEAYTACLRDVCTGVPHGLHLCLKSDLITQFASWIEKKRNDTDYNWMEYPFCNELMLDRDGTWYKSEKWTKQITDIFHVKYDFSDPDKKNTNARAENAVRELERRTKSGLFSKNLPPEEWVMCADQANWVNARLPHRQRSRDGDDILPLEALTNGAHSRRRIKQELSFFVPAGTPCLVWNPKIKGSDLNSKVRWGIAQRMTNKAVEFKCPYNNSLFASRSYLAINLRTGVNYYQFLGLRCPQLSNTAMVPNKVNTPMYVTLPDLTDAPDQMETPSTSIQTTSIPDPQPFVHILDPNGRVFKADENGTFQHCGSSMNDPDNDLENEGFLRQLTDKGTCKNGWNDTASVNRDYNQQILTLANRPRDRFHRQDF
jgi:hypothetical protein